MTIETHPIRRRRLSKADRRRVGQKASRVLKSQERRPLSKQEQMDLLAACTDFRDKLIVVGLIDTGLRISELLGLRPQDMDWQHNVINAPNLKTHDPKRDRKNIPMSPRLRPLFEMHFSMADRIPMTRHGCLKLVKRAMKRAKLTAPAMLHVLRDTACVNMLQAGVDIKAVQQIMGHSSIAVTEKYLKYSGTMAVDEVKRKMGWT